MGHFGEIRLADPVFSAVVLPNNSKCLRAQQTSVQSQIACKHELNKTTNSVLKAYP